MEILDTIFGTGEHLTTLQMLDRGILAFVITLVLVRISGRRSFGLKTPLDNIVVILLGAILSRGVVGASPFVPIIVTATGIVLIHRLLGYILTRNRKISGIIEGEKILLFQNGTFLEENLKKALVCREDVMQGVRNAAQTSDLNKIDRVYIERNGGITVIKKLSVA